MDFSDVLDIIVHFPHFNVPLIILFIHYCNARIKCLCFYCTTVKLGKIPVLVVEIGCRNRPDPKIFFYLRSEEHTSELQSRGHLVCRLLLEKKKKKRQSQQKY